MQTSHRYDFNARDVLALVAPPLVFVGLVAGLFYAGAFWQLLPRPCPALDTDRTILLHQADASRRPQRADIVLIGDSSCLMDVSADQVNHSWGGRHIALNLGTLSYLDLNAFGTLLQNYVAANPHRLQTVVLLMHPEALRRASAAEYDVAELEHYYAGTDYCSPGTPPLLCAVGVERFRGRLLSRAVPQPLPGGFGRRYGFTHDLWRYLSAHSGSAVDPGQFNPATAQGNAEYRLAPQLEGASASFRARLPKGVRLLVGITPVPASYATPGYAQVQKKLLFKWMQWLKADAAFTELPATLPDNLFASTTHLNEKGINRYTELIKEAL